MKKVMVIGYTIICLAVQSIAQFKEIVKVDSKDYPEFKTKEQYKYPQFTRSEIYLKNGDTAFVSINLDYFDQQIKYISAGDTMDIGKKDIKYIKIGTDTIFNQNKVLYEWVGSSSVARIAMKHEMIYKNSEIKGGAFGTASPNFKIEKHTSLLGGIELNPDDILVFSNETTYYIQLFKEGDFVVANKKNLAGLFPNSDVEDYIKDNKLDLNNIDDLLKAFAHAHKRK